DVCDDASEADRRTDQDPLRRRRTRGDDSSLSSPSSRFPRQRNLRQCCWTNSMQSGGRKGMPARNINTHLITVLFLSVSALSFAPLAIAQSVESAQWIGGDGSWTDPTRWSTGTVPNNTASTVYAVSIDNGNSTNSQVNVGVYEQQVTFTVNSL